MEEKIRGGECSEKKRGGFIEIRMGLHILNSADGCTEVSRTFQATPSQKKIKNCSGLERNDASVD